MPGSRILSLVIWAVVIIGLVPTQASARVEYVDVDVRYADRGRASGTRVLPHAAHGGALVEGPAAIRRYRADGIVDGTFGRFGIVRLGSQYGPYSPKPRFVSDPLGRVTINESSRIRRLRDDGQGDDESFATGGSFPVATLGLGDRSYFSRIAIRADGTILAIAENDVNAWLVSFDQNGDLDRAFGSNGLLQLDMTRNAALKVLPDGRLVISGNARTRCSGGCTVVTMVDEAGRFVGTPVETMGVTASVITPLGGGGYAWIGTASFEEGPITYPTVRIVITTGVVSATNESVRRRKVVREGYYSYGPRFDALAPTPDGGFIAAGPSDFESTTSGLSILRFDHNLQLVSLRCCGARASSMFLDIRHGIPTNARTTVDIPRVTASTFDVRVSSMTQDRAIDAATRIRMTYGMRVAPRRPPRITAVWPRARLYLRAHLPVTYSVTPGARAITELTASSFAETGRLVGRRLPGRHVFEVGTGEQCFYLQVRDVLNVGQETRRCLLRPELPTYRATLDDCAERRDRNAYLGKAIVCSRHHASVNVPIGSSGEETVTLVLRTCPTCGSVRISLVSQSERQVRGIDLRTPRRGRRVVTMTMTYAQSLRVSVPRVGSGVVIEGIDA